MVFPVVIYRCERWTIKKAESQRIDTFELLWWKRLESPLDCSEIKPSILKEINPEYLLEELMLKMKLQYFGHLKWRTYSLEKNLVLGKIQGGRRGWHRMTWFDGITGSMDVFEQALGVGHGQGSLVCCSPWGHKESDMTEWLNWTECNLIYHCVVAFLV